MYFWPVSFFLSPATYNNLMAGFMLRPHIPPGPPAYPFVGHLPSFLRDKLGFLTRCVAQYGDVVKLKLGKFTFLLNRPEDIQHVLVTNSTNYEKTPRLTSTRGKRISGEGLVTNLGETHLRQRRMLQPVFYRKSIEAYAEVIVKRVDRMLAQWRSGAEFDLVPAMLRLAQEIMIETLFGHNFKEDAGGLADAISTRRRYFEYTLSSVFPFPEYVPLPIVRKHRHAIKIIDDAIYGAIDRQRDAPVLSPSLLARFMEAKYEDGTGMNDKQVRDEALTFLNTGYETIGAMLAWTIYLVSQHPEIESKLLMELQEVSNGRSPCLEHLSKLRYAAMVLSESLRLYPPTWMFVRVARQRDILPSGAGVPSGTKLYLCPYVTHRHPFYFPEPERFHPERFHARSKQDSPAFAYFPFGGGPRKCIGETFARMEGVLALTAIVQRFKVTLIPGQTVDPEAGIFLRPKNGILMQVVKR